MRALVVAGLIALGSASTAHAATLQQQIDRALKPVRAHAGVSIRDLKKDRQVYKLRAHNVRPLGSTTKLFTAVAIGRGAPKSVGTAVRGPDANGDLYLVGGGDPGLGRAQFEELAREVKAAGVTAVSGGIVGDGSRFDGPGQYDPEIGGMVGALVYARGRAVDGGPIQEDPALAAATRFDDALEAIGVTVARGQRVAAAPAGLPAIASVVSEEPDAMVRRMLVASDNFLAAMLTKVLAAEYAAPGTQAAGVALIEELSDGRAKLVDGTGLSDRSRATPYEVGALLRGRPEYLRRYMPVAGRDGTVAHRMRDTRGRCRVKTGTIRGAKVSTLSGYCGRYAFSVLVQGASIERAERAQDAVARVLARAR